MVLTLLNAKKMYPDPGSFVLFDSRTIHRGSPVEDNVRKNTVFKRNVSSNANEWAS